MILTSTCISGVNQGSIADLHQDIRRDASPTGRLFGMSNSDPIRVCIRPVAPEGDGRCNAGLRHRERRSTSWRSRVKPLRLAMEVATLAHLDQFRKNGIKSDEDPYIVHPLRNVLRLLRYGCSDVEILSATALHDTVEDRPHARHRAPRWPDCRRHVRIRSAGTCVHTHRVALRPQNLRTC